MKPGQKPLLPPPPPDPVYPRVFAGLFGCFLGLSLLKFGNPPIMESFVTMPANFYEIILGYPWPISWAYTLLAMLVLAGLLLVRRKWEAPSWLLVLPLLWLIWQIVAFTQSADASLSKVTVKHLTACAVCFYLGFFSLSQVRRLGPFWAGLLIAFVLVLAVGWEQHFGGLEETRRYFFLYLYPQMKTVPPEYLKKINSTRIFSTLFYPNSLAGSLLLLLPLTLALIWRMHRRFTVGARAFLMGAIALGALGCLFWSGSKGGWLLMLTLGLIALLRFPFSQKLKVGLLSAVLIVGLAGFFWKYSGFFQKGATSVSARFDYWRAAILTVKSHPWVGTGPGTFAIAYQKVKRPESEMSRLVHNDYLEQASDSGMPGFLFYCLFIGGSLAWSFRRLVWTNSFAQPSAFPASGDPGSRPGLSGSASATQPDWLRLALWLGILGWSLQSFVEFGLYVPALAWPAFTFLGLALGLPREPNQTAA